MMYCEQCGTRTVSDLFCCKECEELFYSINPNGFDPELDPYNMYRELGGEG